MTALEIRSLSAGYGPRRVLEDVSFAAPAGALVGVLGANGSGKTTLMKSICGILPHTGECLLNGLRLEGLSPRRMAQRCSYIPQRSGIAIDIPALDVVLMGFNPHLRLMERPTPAMRGRAFAALDAVGLADRAGDNFLCLSEGQKQLCILARTLVMDAELLIMDEPESALDFRYRYRLMDAVRASLRERSSVGLVALHDPALALNGCDQLILLEAGRLAGVLRPAEDPLPRMQAALARLYGPISLATVRNAGGEEQLVLLREREATT